MSESDVYIRQLLTSKAIPRSERVKIFIMAVGPYKIDIQMKRKELVETFRHKSDILPHNFINN